MKSSRPYLLRAFYDWIVDNNMTPFVVIDATLPGVDVPQQYVEDGRIVLNLAPTAIRDLMLENTHIGFSARFSGVPHNIYAPMRAVGAIYAKENGRGMVFKDDEDFADAEGGTVTAVTETGEQSSGTASETTDAPTHKSKPDSKQKRSGRPNLTIVK